MIYVQINLIKGSNGICFAMLSSKGAFHPYYRSYENAFGLQKIRPPEAFEAIRLQYD